MAAGRRGAATSKRSRAPQGCHRAGTARHGAPHPAVSTSAGLARLRARSGGGPSIDGAHALGSLEATIHLIPVHVGEEGVDVARGGRTKVDVVAVLVHVHHEQ